MPNQLKDQKSPYLLQHAENPVHWYPWCSQAFETARQEDKPIFLSIGYSTCHWCHVMAHESFEDEEVARILNRSFVCIKVDREERPDVDAVYMSVCQAMTGSGGWPLTILMTPDQKPFYAGTYLPKHSRYGRPGLTELLLQVAELWDSQPEKLLRTGEEVTDWLRTQEQSSAAESSEPSLPLLRRGAAELSKSFDPLWGGFGPAPKFPMPHNLIFLMRYAALEGDEHSLQIAVKTLEYMADGGIYDHIGGGFSRYSTDERWLIPHFEKMLYDNALLIYAYAEAYQITKNPLFLSVIRETVGYVLRELTDEEGGFYCGQDADSDGVEGKYYALTPSEIRKVLGDEDSAYFCRFFGITEEGNFEGKSIPHRIRQTDSTNSDMEEHHPERTFDKYNMHQKHDERMEHQQENVSGRPDTPRNNVRIRVLCEKVYHYRRIRTSLHTDDKILTAWNSLMIAALAKASLIFREPSWLAAAQSAQQFLETRLRTMNGRLHVRYRDGEAAGTGNLEDYAYYAWALLELYQAAWRVEDLEKAVHTAGQIVRFFSDRERGGLYLYASDAEQLISRPKETWDSALPSGNSVSALVFSLLADLTGEERWRTERDRLLHCLAGEASGRPSAHCFALLAMSTVLCPSSQLICASAGDEMPEELSKYLAEDHRPNLTVLLLTPGNRKLLDRLAPFTVSYPLPDSGAVYYLCRGNTCSAGTRNLQELFSVR